MKKLLHLVPDPSQGRRLRAGMTERGPVVWDAAGGWQAATYVGPEPDPDERECRFDTPFHFCSILAKPVTGWVSEGGESYEDTLYWRWEIECRNGLEVSIGWQLDDEAQVAEPPESAEAACLAAIRSIFDYERELGLR